MFNEHSFLVIFVRLLNFAVFIAVCVYFYRRKARPKIEQGIADQVAVAQGMEEVSHILEGRLLELDDELSHQHERAEYLQSKIMEWQSVVDHERIRDEELRIVRLRQINERIHQRSNYVSRLLQWQSVVPKAFAVARSTVQQQMTNPEEQRAFMQQLLQRMKQR